MNQIGQPGHDAVPIGEIVAPPFARTPDPEWLFRRRAARLTALADGHQLGPYLALLGRLANAQADILPDLPAPTLPSDDVRARAREHAMPPLDRTHFDADPACRETLRRFIQAAREIDMPADARQAVETLVAADDDVLAWMAKNVAADTIPVHESAAHIFVAAGLQVHAARLASVLDAGALVPVGDGVCPACGSAPTSSVIVGWEGAHGARFCSCSLCGTLWNYVRIRCTACGSTEGISYQELEAEEGSAEGAVKAECCSKCGTYAKVMQQAKFPVLDPVADDVATLALDMLLGEEGQRRSGRNPFLLGY